MAMKPRTGRSRISKASEAVSKRAEEILPKSGGRSRVSKSDDIASKITGENRAAAAPARRRPDSKADDFARKIGGESKPAAAVPARRRPESKADEIARKIGEESKPAAAVPARRKPESKADSIERKIPSNPGPVPVQHTDPAPQVPQPAKAIPIPTPGTKKSGCCLLPFAFALCVIAGLIIAL